MSSVSDGMLQVCRDVLLESIDSSQVVVLTRRAEAVGETELLELSESGIGPMRVRVLESRPAMTDGAVRHRVRLELVEDGPGVVSPAGAAHPVYQDRLLPPAAGVMLGVLTRELRVRILNCSSSGCLLQADGPLEVGTVASLRLRLGGQDFEDGLHVVRCLALEGSSAYHVGGEFLWTAPPRRQSLRLAIRQRIDGGAVQEIQVLSDGSLQG